MAPIFCDRCGDTLEEGCDPLDELVQLDALLERLTLKREDLRRKINQLHSPIIRQLPSELMSTIFEFCLPNFEDFRPLGKRRQMNKKKLYLPLSLGAICSYWRTIAWSTPDLWSSLLVYVSQHHSDTVIVQEWLSRSGQLPLSIHIISNFFERPFPQWHEALSALADIINRYSARWSDLDLRMPQCFYPLFRATDSHAPILKSIRFHGSRSLDMDHFQLICPRLERADLLYVQLDGSNIQWDNLIHLSIQSVSTIDFFLILREAPRLVFCKASRMRNKDGEQTTAPIFTSLRSLLITDTIDATFLDNLITPCLEEFSLLKCGISLAHLTSFFGRSACLLHSFSITCDLSAFFEGFIDLLSLLPSLKTLSITSPDPKTFICTSRQHNPQNIFLFMDKVVSPSTGLQQELLPNLEVLEWTGELRLRSGNCAHLCPLPPADNAVRGPLQLLKLNIYPTRHIPENAISYFLSLAERGITVNVLSKSEDVLQTSINYYREESLRGDWGDELNLSSMQDFQLSQC